MKKILFSAVAAMMGVMSASALELVTNGGFESGPYTGTGYQYCTPTSWSGGTGLKHKNDTTWCTGVYAGNYAAFFQNWGGVSQVLNFPVAGTYRLSFAYIARGGPYSPHYRCVNLGSKCLLTYTASSTSWSTAAVNFEVTAPGPQTLSFGATSVSGDMCSCADAVSCYLLTPAEAVTDCSSWRQLKAVLEAGGSVRLVKNITEDSTCQGVTLAGSQNVTLDLNGYSITACTTSRPFTLNDSKTAKLTIKDSVGGGVINGQSASRSNCSGGCVYIGSGCSFTFEGGTIKNFKTLTHNGGAICNNGTLAMKGGTIENCHAEASDGCGGAIHHSAGTLTLSGGMITNCTAKACGGGIRATGGTVNLSGTKIVDCRTNRNGNGIQMHGSLTFNMTGGEVVGCGDIDGSTSDFGGAILVWADVTANFKGGVIANNTTAGKGGAITFGDACAGVNITGGIFSNNVCNASGKELLYRYNGSKTASVTGGFFDKNPLETAANTSFGAVVDTATGYVAGNPAASNKDGELIGGTYPFCPTNELYTGVGVAIADDATLSGSGSSWTITSTNPVECSTWLQVRGNLLANNNVKLVKNIEQGSGPQALLESGQDVTLDLCGKTITMTSEARLASINSATLTIDDSVGGGVIDGSNVNRTGSNGACVGLWKSDSVLNFKGGTIQNFKNTVYEGAAFFSNAGGTITMSGGVISNCCCTASSKNGGAVCTAGSFTMSGGTIIDCTSAALGGSAYVSGTFTMTGGMITNCTSTGSGGAIYCNAGKITMKGGRIVGNTSGTWGGGVSISSGATMTFEGGEISYNTANGTTGGGGICSSGKVTMKGGRIVGNKAPNQTTSTAFYSNLDDSDLIYGGVIEGTIQRDQTADLYLYGGVYDRDQTSYCASGYTCTKVGDKYVVGVTPATDQNTLMTGGSYTFCPTNAEYVAAGLSLGGDATVIDLGGSWKVASSGLVEVSDWLQMKYNLESGNSVKVMTNIQATTAHIYPLATTNVTIDLNGFEVTQNAANYMFELNTAGTGTMTVMDSSAAGTGAFVGNGTTTGGDGGNWVRLYSSGRGVILESGTIRNFTLNNTYGGGAIKVFAGTTFTMYGGTISNCVTSGSGGAIRNAGTVRIYGGTIDHCRTTTSAGSGGALLSDASTTTEIYGGTFSSNSVASGAYGAVAYASAVIKVYGGYFVGNEAAAGYCKIIHGTSWNVYGYIYGGVFDNYDPVGTASSGNTDARCLLLQNGATVTRVGDNYVVGCNAAQDAEQAYTGGQFTFPLTNEIYTTKGVALAAGSSVTQNGSHWIVGDGAEVECSTWQEIAAAALQGRNIKLTNDVTQTTSPISTCYLDNGQQIALDLNGHKLTKYNGYWLFGLRGEDVKLTIVDSKSGGQIVNTSGGSVSADGGCFWVSRGELVLNGGTMSGFSATGHGGFAYVASGAKFTMNGGTITGCQTTGTDKDGGAVYCLGTFMMYGGTIENCTAKRFGGGVNLNSGTCEMHGGTIKGCKGTTSGGAYRCQGTSSLKIYGGSILNNNGCLYGGVCIAPSTSVVEFHGGYYAGNYANNGDVFVGDNWVVFGKLYGGVFNNYDPSVKHSDETAQCLILQDGAVSRPVGSNYIVGKKVLGFSVDSVGTLLDGTYTFCPTNAEYVAGGVVLDSGSTFAAGTNDVWTLTAPKPIAVSTWAQLKATLESGFSAKLMADVAQSAAVSQVSLTTVGMNVTLDLNGHTVTCYSLNSRLVDVYAQNGAGATFTLKDSVGTGVVKDGSYQNGGGVWIGPGNFFVMEGGTIYNCSGSDKSGAVYVNQGTFTMSGGTIDSCKNTSLGGGAVYVTANGSFAMNGGIITNSTAASNGGAVYNAGTFAMSNGVITACQAIGSVASSHGGGGVYNAGGTFDMAGGLITGCSATNGTGSNAWNGGGGICNASGTTYIRGTISNCTARCAAGVGGRGGTIYLYDEGAIIRNYGSYTTPASCDGTGVLVDGGHFTMYGGRICDNYGPSGLGFSGIVMWSSGNTFTMYGGIVAGNTNTSGKSDKQIAVWSGKVVLNGGLLEQEPLAANVQGKDGSFTVPQYRKVGDYYVVGTGVDSNADDELTHGVYTFCPTNALYEAAGLAVDTVNSALAYTNEAWQLTSNAGTPVNVSSWDQLCAALQAGYSVKLTNDITQTGAQPSLAGNQVVTVDLNGYTIDRKSWSGSYWCFATSSTNVCLTITDTSAEKTGRILGDPTKSHGSGGNALRVGSGKMIINGGTFEGMYATAGGGCAYVSAGATLEMNGGTIKGCKSTGTDGYGAGVRCHGTFVMNGGVITNCTTEYYGGGVAVGSGGVFTMNGGTIAGCSATKASTAMGGGVWSAGTVDFNGGMITNCTAALNGGGISINPGTLNLKGGMIVDCWTPDYGGGVRANGGTINLSGTKIVGCRAWCNGNGFVVDGSCTFNMTGGEVIGCGDVAGKAARGWGGAVIFWTGVTANVYGGVIANNTTAGNGAAITFGSTCKAVNIYGGVFSNNVGAAAQKILYRYTDSSSTANVYGGIFDTNPTTTTAATTVRDVVKAGDWYVVGRGTLASGTTLTGGEYTFNPTNAETKAVGLTTSVAPVEYATTPTTWTIDAKWYCVCGDETKGIPGHVHEKVMFLPWASTTTLPTGAGNYYLTGDVQLAAQWAAVNGVVLDLAGHTVTQKTANTRVMYVPANVTFTLTDSVGGGKLTGGNLTSDYGGGVYVHAANAKFVMYGGSICGNKAKSGAGMYVNTATSSVKIYGGFVENNLAAEWGGAFCLCGGTQEIRNCIIRNNQATVCGGGAARFDGTTVEFIDCVITNNAAAYHGGFSAHASYSTKIALGGTTVMKDNHVIGQTAQNNLGVSSGRTYTASTLVPLTDGAEIGVTSDVAPGSILVTGINAADYAKYFFSDNDKYAIVNDLNQVKLTTVAQVCATIGETQYSSLQLALNSAVDGDTIKLVRNTTESVIVGPDGEIALDLAGFVLKANGGSAVTLNANANLTLTNSDETVTHYFTVGANGLWTWNDSSTSGAVAYETLTARPAANAVIAVKGGCITGGNATRGGGVNVADGSQFVLTGGTIVGNTSSFGAVYLGRNNVSYLQTGGAICGNLATVYGGGMLSDGGVITMTGGDIMFNTDTSTIKEIGGGGVLTYADMTFEGGRISWNSTAVCGGGIFLGSGTLNLKGGIIEGCSAAQFGGGVRAGGGTINLSGTKIVGCRAQGNGNAIQMNTSTFNMTGGEIVECGDIAGQTPQTYGGAVLFWSGVTANIYGGVIANNTTGGNGGAITFGDTCSSVNVYGGVFSNNVGAAGKDLLYRYTGSSSTATVWGGIFDKDPTTTTSATTVKTQDLVGDWYVVGTKIAQEEDKLSSGTYTFCPTNAEYAAAGLEKQYWTSVSADETVDPVIYTLTDDRIVVEIPSVAHTTVTNITVNGKIVAVASTAKVPEGETIVVYYKPDEGYLMTGAATATLTNVTEEHKTIDASEVTAKWHHTHCICGDGECEVGGHVHADLEWQKWTGTTSLPTSAGNWYLANDVTLSSTYAPPTGVKLCLNGKVVKQGGSCNKLVNINGAIFALTDCTDTPHYFNKVNAGYRSDVWVYSLTTSPSASSICVKGGCITGGYGWSGSPSHSPCLNVVNGGTFNFYCGNLVGNCAEQTAAGMRVYDGATLNMYGGNVEGNYSSWGFCNLEGTANIYGGSFRNNGNCSGGLACSGVTTIYDVEVSGNVSYGGAAGLYANGTFMMLGGKVFGNRTTANNGGFEIAATATATIGGNVCVTGNYCNASRSGFEYSGGAVNNLYLPADKTVTLSTETPLAEGVKIGVTTATKPTSGTPVAVTGVNAADYSDFFFSDSDDYYIYNSANTVVLGKTGNPVVKDKEGNDVTIEIPDDWRKAHKVTSEEVMKPEKKLKNGHPAWQNYVLGIDPTNELSGVYADAPQNKATDKVTVKTKNVVKVADGYSVQYRLDTKLGGAAEYTKGTPQASADIDVTLSGVDPTGLYKLNVVISKGDTEIDQSAEALNVVGLVKATNTNRFSVVAVPWNRLAPGEEAEIAVSNVIKTATLEAGDKLHVFNRLAKTYDTWTLNEQKEWDSVVTYAIAADGTLSASVSGVAATETIARGSGIWLERMNPTNAPYFLYGQASSNAVEYVIEEGHNLIGAPGVEAFDFSRVKGAAEGDQILVPGVVPKLYTIKDGVWGYFKTVAKTINVKGTLKTTFKAVWTTTENTAPAGTGFWLINKSGNNITIE